MEKLLIEELRLKSLNEIFGTSGFQVIAGPCAVESREQLSQVAECLKTNNVKFLRGGAFKPRTSPYSFQGLGEEGLRIIHEVGKEYGLFTVSEIMDVREVEKAYEYLDVIQIGSRNMQNFPLLNEVGKTDKPVLLKRGFMSTLDEFMLSAEYILAGGNRNLIMCERGVRSFDNDTRAMLDFAAIAILNERTTLSVVGDISHSLGRRDIDIPIAKAVMAVGADALMVEVHPSPDTALSDGKQQLNPEQFTALLRAMGL